MVNKSEGNTMILLMANVQDLAESSCNGIERCRVQPVRWLVSMRPGMYTSLLIFVVIEQELCMIVPKRR